MPDVIASSMVIRFRHPVHEAGMQTDFCCTTQEWIADADGKTVPMPEKGPFTPAQLVAKGFSLPAIMDQITQTAVLARDTAMSQRDVALTERDVARAERDAARAALAG